MAMEQAKDTHVRALCGEEGEGEGGEEEYFTSNDDEKPGQ